MSILLRRPTLGPKNPRFFLLLLALVLLGGSGCAGRLKTERIPRMQWLVLPLTQPPAMGETPRAIRGWWFGARTIRQNPRAGETAADLLTRHLAELGYVNLYTTIDLRYYFADKRQALQSAFPHLTPTEIDEQISRVNPLAYGQQLGADKILTGRIIQLYMGENRTIHWWWSVGDLEFSVIDVATGKIEWQKRYGDRDHWASTTTVLDKLISRATEDLEDEYFRPLTE